ncbi:MAG: tRNA (adenosine(37)-N6)-threonylcarbamoyltransferase complex ATPase subunit type 1 TsaE [Deltaproteobacteria bacterium]|nr:tRNA (adenosine(37)-N6)-threonylcarbamoyltransferase complex ATPase subunit type 1 TsaE [Deltaproteobacteria bacterium]
MISRSIEETQKCASDLARRLKPGDVVALVGDLGAGKTAFVQGLAKGLGVPKDAYVRSPTFTLIAEYSGRMPLYHLDLYRLRDARELDGLGLEEYFDGRGITVVEWADRFPGILPERTITVSFSIVDETTREIVVPAGYGTHRP